MSERVRKLQRSGVIRRFTAHVDYGAVGFALDAFVDIRLLPATNPDKFEATVGSMSQVRELAFVTGRFDYQARVACVDADDLDHVLRTIRTKGGAAVTETRIILRTRASSAAVSFKTGE